MYSENAVDVFDVNTMEWIQTIPLKKVSTVVSQRHLWRRLLDQMNESSVINDHSETDEY